MNKLQEEHKKRLNPTGIKWSDMTEEQQEDLRNQWNDVVSKPKNLSCTCPRTGCRNNRNCNFCVITHRVTGSLPDCLRIVKDNLQAEVPPEKRHNVHADTPPGRANVGATREEYAKSIMQVREGLTPEQQEEMKKRARRNTELWHAWVREPENKVCACTKTDCWYHGNCVKCIALHKYYNGFPACCQDIYDEIDAAIQIHEAEVRYAEMKKANASRRKTMD